MYDPNRDEEIDELLRQVDELLGEEDSDDIDLSRFTPEGTEDDEPMVYRNFSNNYGEEVRNFANNYGQGETIPAYNADFRRSPKEQPRAAQPIQPESRWEEPAPEPKKKKKKKKRGCGCGTMILALILIIVGAVALVNWFVRPPQSAASIGQRKEDTATILLCGVDQDGTRTDTIMLLYLSGSENQARILSLPRDTYTITAAGNASKLNAAYARNGKGEEGMEGLLDYVQELIGYRPDGYILVDFSLVAQIVDVMGGIYYDVPQDMEVSGVSLKAGYQYLNGKQVLTLLRFRKGYATADLGRVQVQRDVIAACMEQWFTLDHLAYVGEALSTLENGSLSSLNLGNYIWMAKTILTGMDSLTGDTLPGYAAMRGGASYYILYPDRVAKLINESYNPYTVTITQSMLNIAE